MTCRQAWLPWTRIEGPFETLAQYGCFPKGRTASNLPGKLLRLVSLRAGGEPKGSPKLTERGVGSIPRTCLTHPVESMTRLLFNGCGVWNKSESGADPSHSAGGGFGREIHAWLQCQANAQGYSCPGHAVLPSALQMQHVL